MSRITNHLRDLRKRHRLSQSELLNDLATLNGGERPVSRQQYSHYETGRSDLPLRVLGMLCQYYNVQPGDILTLAENSSPENANCI